VAGIVRMVEARMPGRNLACTNEELAFLREVARGEKLVRRRLRRIVEEKCQGLLGAGVPCQVRAEYTGNRLDDWLLDLHLSSEQSSSQLLRLLGDTLQHKRMFIECWGCHSGDPEQMLGHSEHLCETGGDMLCGLYEKAREAEPLDVVNVVLISCMGVAVLFMCWLIMAVFFTDPLLNQGLRCSAFFPTEALAASLTQPSATVCLCKRNIHELLSRGYCMRYLDQVSAVQQAVIAAFLMVLVEPIMYWLLANDHQCFGNSPVVRMLTMVLVSLLGMLALPASLVAVAGDRLSTFTALMGMDAFNLNMPGLFTPAFYHIFSYYFLTLFLARAAIRLLFEWLMTRSYRNEGFDYEMMHGVVSLALVLLVGPAFPMLYLLMLLDELGGFLAKWLVRNRSGWQVAYFNWLVMLSRAFHHSW
jgi:hypothetical protein